MYWQVEAVLEARDVSGKREYKVKWKGYDEQDNSWEPAANLTPDIRAEAEKKFPVPSSSKTKVPSSVRPWTQKKKSSDSKYAISGSGDHQRKKQKTAATGPADISSSGSSVSFSTPTTSPVKLQSVKSPSISSTRKSLTPSPPKTQQRQSSGPTSKLISGKRKDYLSWDEYFMLTAKLSAQRSKDPKTQVGCCVVNSEKKIVGIGYNGMPIGLSDDIVPWSASDDIINSKYTYVCHAELNAILNRNSADLNGCVLYSTLFPCNECAKVIIQSRIREVVFHSDQHASKPEFIASRQMLLMAKVTIRQLSSNRSITLSL